MAICSNCRKIYADKFPTCPHCGTGSKTAPILMGITLLAAVALGIIFLSDKSAPEGAKTAKWQSISGVQQGQRLVMDIDANSIERTADGVSAKVRVRITPDQVEQVTYICRAPASGVPGAVIWNGKVTNLAPASTGDAIMRRVCFGDPGQEK